MKLLKDSWEKEYYMRPSFKDIITRIEAIMVDATVPDAAAANFWKALFPGQVLPPPYPTPLLILAAHR